MKCWIRASLLATAAFSCLGTPANAQQTNQPKQELKLEEIVVTARKRAENIQSVPIAITAFSEAEMKERGAYRLRDLEFAVPNLLVVGGPDNSSIDITLRGIRASAFNAGFESGLSVYVDGVVLGRPFGFNQDFADFERVEVLRGPQGSTFGKNTISGAISMVTRKPGPDTEVRGSVRIGNYGLRQGYASVNVPVTNRVFTKFTAFGNYRDGYVDNPNGPDLDDDGAYGGRIQLRAIASDRLTIDINADLLDEDRLILYGEAADNVPGAIIGPRSASVNILPTERRKLRGVSVSADYDTDIDATLTSITALRDARATTTADSDRTALNLVDSLEDSDQWQFSQELRLASPSNRDFSYVAGLYFFRQGLIEDQIDYLRPGLGVFRPNFRSVRASVDTINYAGFGNVTYRMNEKVEFFGGLRADYERKKLGFVQTGAPIPGSNINIPYFAEDQADTTVTPTAGVSYYLTENQLLFAKYARGVKSGGWNAEFSATRNIEFGPEFVDSYEVGLKSDWLDDRLRLNVAAFYLDYKDLQVATFVPSTAGISIENAASAYSQGIEIEAIVVPVEGLNLQASYGYVDAEYTNFIGAGGRNLSGTRLPSAAEHTFGASAAYNAAIGPDLLFNARADYSYRGPAVSSLSVRDRALLSLQDKGINLVNARIGLADADGSWELSLYARNLFDELYLTSVGRSFSGADNATYGPPRTYGVQLDFKF